MIQPALALRLAAATVALTGGVVLCSPPAQAQQGRPVHGRRSGFPTSRVGRVAAHSRRAEAPAEERPAGTTHSPEGPEHLLDSSTVTASSMSSSAEDVSVDLTEEAAGPWTLFDGLLAGSDVTAGGWLQVGWHDESTDLFNSDPDRLNLHQAWLFAEKLADGSGGGLDWGFRIDALWGTDAGDTSSFGNPDGGWDAGESFDSGDGYGLALPQLYLELASGDFNLKAGHFYTLIGYEVVGAPGNFFYSHAITMYNSEPFTHTGVLASWAASPDTTLYGGWTAGWDTGFDRFEDGSNFLGGVATSLSDDATVAYMTTIGDFGARGKDGFMQSVVLDVALGKDLNYVVQSDLLSVGSSGEDTVGLNQYLFYDVDEDLAVGARLEWWKADALTGYAPHGGDLSRGGMLSYYEATVGANYRLNANTMVRPEFRYDWSDDADYEEGILAVDLIVTF